MKLWGTIFKTGSEPKKKRKMFRRRAAIEPIIGHLKSDHRLSRNYLKGFVGDEINLLMAATAFNLKKWMNNYLQMLLALFLAMLFMLVWQDKMQSGELSLLVWKFLQ